MKRKLKFGITIVLGTVFAAVAIGYAFFQPFIPGAVYDAIPAQATFKHKAESLEELLKSPVCAQLDEALGAGNSVAALLASTDWIKLAAPSEIAVAGIPLRYAGKTKAWVAVNWVGWRSPWLRWKLEHSRAPGLSFMGKHAVWPIWNYETQGIARGTSLTLALTDNLFMVCLSENPSDILLLLDTYDHRIPSINDAK
ncbi:MAG: hypothetical protein DRP64_14055 [Verrucomicrobia bacterium]|nr:MAG: hypothetical protein DRP64_14055 [Verrucomicrobiota bacterium]